MIKRKHDIAVVGAGFAGSLTALGLNRMGYRVVLIEKQTHPRFAIGESSTPIADMILRALAYRYDLPWLAGFSRYGSWQDQYPEVACGLKRGFSYYKHQAGQPFRTDERHSGELLVAASVSDRQSDTHWFRSDMDAFLAAKVREAGIDYIDQTTITSIDRVGERWELGARKNNNLQSFDCRWIIDATGSGALLCQLGVGQAEMHFQTRTWAVFSHFRGVRPWRTWLQEHDIPTGDYPYDPDSSALHHMLDEGWLWMLRFNNGITSAGLVLDERVRTGLPQNKRVVWQQTIGRYPSLADLFEEAAFADQPGQLLSTQRLQRKSQKVAGRGWVALPHTAGFVDPLHSTGIAHYLSGVERVLYAFESGNPGLIAQSGFPETYEKAIFRELHFIDVLVDGCYRARDNFDLFAVYNMLYFTATVHYEQKRLRGDFDIEKHNFLSADHPHIPALIRRCYEELREIVSRPPVTKEAVAAFRAKVTKAIASYNTAGLLDPDIPNMYKHTVADLGTEIPDSQPGLMGEKK